MIEPTTPTGKRIMEANDHILAGASWDDLKIVMGTVEELCAIEREAAEDAIAKQALLVGPVVTSHDTLKAGTERLYADIAAAERKRLRGEWDDLANILMDMRVDSPLWKPPSTMNYRQASQELARRILHDLLEEK